jgi:chorismate mutase
MKDKVKPAREDGGLERVAARAAECGLPPESARTVFETVFRLVREHHRAFANGGERNERSP